MKDIAKWLRGMVPHCDDPNNYDEWELGMLEAADEIERLREALREIGKKLSPEKYDNEVCLETYCGELARAALGEGN